MIDTIRKLLDAICIGILLLLLIVGALYMWGVKPFLMITGSMEPNIPVGSICFIDTNYDYEKIRVNDIIMYQTPKQK